MQGRTTIENPALAERNGKVQQLPWLQRGMPGKMRKDITKTCSEMLLFWESRSLCTRCCGPSSDGLLEPIFVQSLLCFSLPEELRAFSVTALCFPSRGLRIAVRAAAWCIFIQTKTFLEQPERGLLGFPLLCS